MRQRLPRRAEEAIPSSFHKDATAFTDAEEAWLSHVIDASNVEELRTIVDDVPVDHDRYQRLRLGMALSDNFDQVWSSARALAVESGDAVHRSLALWVVPVCVSCG